LFGFFSFFVVAVEWLAVLRLRHTAATEQNWLWTCSAVWTVCYTTSQLDTTSFICYL